MEFEINTQILLSESLSFRRIYTLIKLLTLRSSFFSVSFELDTLFIFFFSVYYPKLILFKVLEFLCSCAKIWTTPKGVEVSLLLYYYSIHQIKQNIRKIKFKFGSLPVGLSNKLWIFLLLHRDVWNIFCDVFNQIIIVSWIPVAI